MRRGALDELSIRGKILEHFMRAAVVQLARLVGIALRVATRHGRARSFDVAIVEKCNDRAGRYRLRHTGKKSIESRERNVRPPESGEQRIVPAAEIGERVRVARGEAHLPLGVFL